MKKPLTRSDLDVMICDEPGCTNVHSDLVFSPRCHPRAPLKAYYASDTGCMHFVCSQCRTGVAEVLVAGDSAKTPS